MLYLLLHLVDKMLAELLELRTLEASDDRVWCVAWNPAGTL